MKAVLNAFVVVCAALLLVACAPQAAAPAVPPASDHTPPVTAPPVQQQPASATNPPAGVPYVIPDDVQAALRKGSAQADDGYAYFYQALVSGKIAPVTANTFSVKERGAVRKITLDQVKQLSDTYWLSYYVLDTDALTATGYCNRRECGGTPNPSQTARGLSYADYTFRSPTDWLAGLSAVKKLGDETVDGHAVYRLSALFDSRPVTVWVDHFSGLPLRVVDGTNEYDYTKIALGVTETEVAP